MEISHNEASLPANTFLEEFTRDELLDTIQHLQALILVYQQAIKETKKIRTYKQNRIAV